MARQEFAGGLVDVSRSDFRMIGEPFANRPREADSTEPLHDPPGGLVPSPSRL